MKFIILTKEDLLRMLACLILGALLGAALVNYIIGQHFDQLVYINQSLKQQLEEEQARLKQFERNYYGTPVVRKVVLRLFSNEDKHTEQELEKKIKDLLTGLVGLEISELDASILREVIHNRVIPINENTFLLQLETIVLDDDLTFFVRAQKNANKDLADE